MSDLLDALRLDVVPHDELITALTTLFPTSQTHGDGAVIYGTASGGVGMTLFYRDGSIVRAERGAGLTDQLFNELRRLVDGLATPGPTSVVREVWFSLHRVNGYWRHADAWQLTPAPPQAPRPEFLIAEHPFVVELRVERSDDMMVTHARRRRRAWELHLILSLVLNGRITRYGERPQHVWGYVDVPPAELRAAYVQVGYFVPDFVGEQRDFSAVEGLERLPVVDDAEYFSRYGISGDGVLEVPAMFEFLLQVYETAAPKIRDKFLRACYWRDRASASWDVSASLSFVAAANAIEVLLPVADEDRCPTCGLNRAPGVTRRFAEFLERYAPDVPEEERRELYRLRSSLVHGHVLFDLDIPGAWGGLVPRDIEQREALTATLQAARVAAINWLLAEGRAETD